eukprot:scaffold49765_cov47-Phaeocystis_antarctica.AAC.2
MSARVRVVRDRVRVQVKRPPAARHPPHRPGLPGFRVTARPAAATTHARPAAAAAALEAVA